MRRHHSYLRFRANLNPIACCDCRQGLSGPFASSAHLYSWGYNSCSGSVSPTSAHLLSSYEVQASGLHMTLSSLLPLGIPQMCKCMQSQ